MNRKRISTLLVLSLLLLVAFAISFSYSLFQSNVEGEAEATIADWLIKVNDTLISTGQTEYFTIDEIHYTRTNRNIRPGKFAPGISGYYDVEIETTGTQVAVRYNIYVDELESENFKVSNIDLMQGSSNFTRISEREFTGVIPLGSRVNQLLRIYLVWEDLNTPEANAEDSAMGTKDSPNVNVPVTMNFIQYLGE